VAEVKVELPQGAYSIHISSGGINSVGRLIRDLGIQEKALVVSDEIVGALYGEAVIKSLQNSRFEVELICVPPGEKSKDMAVVMEIYNKAVGMGLDRRSPVIALGGGVVGDLAGFVAATYMRGVPFIQIPTTLLAMVDSSVGGKVGVNHPLGKNLIGAFYQPRLVLADLAVLDTLPARELHAGLAEIIKYGIINDTALFTYLQKNCAQLRNKDEDALTEVISRSCHIKAWVVEQDEKENHLRMILNLGHTIGHAVEGNTGYSRYRHGEAIAVGMYAVVLLSQYLGLCTVQTVEAVRELLNVFELPLTAKDCQPDQLMSFLKRDKKNIGGAINWVLVRKLGEVVITRDVPTELIQRVLCEIT